MHQRRRIEKEPITKKLKWAVTKIIGKKLQAAEKMELQTRRTKKAKPEKPVLRKSVDQPRWVVASTRPKLKERLTKWHDRYCMADTLGTEAPPDSKRRGLLPRLLACSGVLAAWSTRKTRRRANWNRSGGAFLPHAGASHPSPWPWSSWRGVVAGYGIPGGVAVVRALPRPPPSVPR